MVATTDSVMLEVKDLSKRFSAVQALKNVTFRVNKGEVFGFLGPNGAGKTTTMRIVTCFMPATSGEVLVGGVNTRVNDLEVRKKIGYLPENNPLYLDMTVEEYLKFIGEVRGMTGAKLSSRMADMFNLCGLTKMAKRQVGKLSKGYKQRVGLAQAMLHDPDLLILDEPMTGLDPNQIIEIRNLIKALGNQKTVIYCSHILSEVSATCSRILIINEGSIVADGTPSDLMSHATKNDGYVVRVKADKQSAEAVFGQVPGVIKAKAHGTGEWCDVEITASHGSDIGESLFKSTVGKGWSLSELKHETASLEDVFTQLTRG
jgi:ABC-2 type transport system ATP-binding protein